MQQVTVKDLEIAVAIINNAAGYGRTAQPPVGGYCLDRAYGGNMLVRLCPDGGTETVMPGGHVPRRQMWHQLQAFLAGWRAAECAAVERNQKKEGPVSTVEYSGQQRRIF